jgi:Na+-translocating ferredoxin:NAD+ oxidoreductase RnfD subunit
MFTSERRMLLSTLIEPKKYLHKKVRLVLPDMVVVNLESINNLKEWSIASYVLTLIGGVVVGGIFLFFQQEISWIVPTLSLIVGVIMILLGIALEWKKFSSFTKTIERSGISAGSIYYAGDTLATEEDYKVTG